jgi:hypothetical protein
MGVICEKFRVLGFAGEVFGLRACVLMGEN